MASGILNSLTSAFCATLVSALLVSTAGAQGDNDLLQTDWIEFVKGYKDAESGVQVRDVVTDSDTGAMQLQIAVPKARMADVMEMEEVRVVGQRPQNIDLLQWLPELEYEWVDDYDNDFYGLLVRFNEEQRLPLRLYFSSESGYVQP